jgi:hypothetical protein
MGERLNRIGGGNGRRKAFLNPIEEGAENIGLRALKIERRRERRDPAEIVRVDMVESRRRTLGLLKLRGFRSIR